MGRETIARLLSNRARFRLSSTKNAPREVRGDGDGGGVGTGLGVGTVCFFMQVAPYASLGQVRISVVALAADFLDVQAVVEG